MNDWQLWVCTFCTIWTADVSTSATLLTWKTHTHQPPPDITPLIFIWRTCFFNPAAVSLSEMWFWRIMMHGKEKLDIFSAGGDWGGGSGRFWTLLFCLCFQMQIKERHFADQRVIKMLSYRHFTRGSSALIVDVIANHIMQSKDYQHRFVAEYQWLLGGHEPELCGSSGLPPPA